MFSENTPQYVLIVSSTEKGAEPISTLDLKLGGSVTVAKSGGEARRLLVFGNYGLIIINAPLSDEFGHESHAGRLRMQLPALF